MRLLIPLIYIQIQSHAVKVCHSPISGICGFNRLEASNALWYSFTMSKPLLIKANGINIVIRRNYNNPLQCF